MSNKHWFPMYPGDWLASTQHFTTEQHGAYLLLLMHYWSIQGAITSDREELRMVCKLSKHSFDKYFQNIMGKFSLKNEKYFHKRMDAEIAKSVDLYEKRSAAGRASVVSKGGVLLNQPQPQLHIKENTKRKREETKQHKHDFAVWYDLYPKKVGKAAAEKVWLRDKPEFLLLITNLENQIAHDKNYGSNKQFCPNPATYLNQKRWNDEIQLEPKPEMKYTSPNVASQSFKIFDPKARVEEVPGIDPYEDMK